MTLIPEEDRWPAQLEGPFAFLFARGFRVVAGETYRLGEWTVLGKDFAGVYLDGDADSQGFTAALMRLDRGRLPERWYYAQIPPVRLGLKAVTELLAPERLEGLAALPPLRDQSDRLPHLKFWADVIQAVAMPWLDGDQEWFLRVARQLASRRA